jgi:hypothetical protein
MILREIQKRIWPRMRKRMSKITKAKFSDQKGEMPLSLSN